MLVLSQVVETEHALDLFSEWPEGFGYLLKDRVLEWTTSSTRLGAWRAAGPRSTPRSSLS